MSAIHLTPTVVTVWSIIAVLFVVVVIVGTHYWNKLLDKFRDYYVAPAHIDPAQLKSGHESGTYTDEHGKEYYWDNDTKKGTYVNN